MLPDSKDENIQGDDDSNDKGSHHSFLNTIFTFLYPLSRTSRDPSKRMSCLIWGVNALQCIGLAFYGNHIPDFSIFSRVMGFFDGSGLLSTFSWAPLVFVTISSVIILSLFLFLLISSLTYKVLVGKYPRLLRGFQTFFHLLIRLFSIWFLSILISPSDCTSSGTLRVNPDVDCWDGRHLIVMSIGIVMAVFYTLLHALISTFVFSFDPKHGGLDSTTHGGFLFFLSLFMAMQSVVMRVANGDRGWRGLLTLIPSGALVITTILLLPFHHKSKNIVVALTLNGYFWIRFATEIALFFVTPLYQYVTYAIFFVICIGVSVFLGWFIHHRTKSLIFLDHERLPLFDPGLSADDLNGLYYSQTSEKSSIPPENMKKLSTLNRISPLLFPVTIRFLMDPETKSTPYRDYAHTLIKFKVLRSNQSGRMLFEYGLFNHFFLHDPAKAQRLLRQAQARSPPVSSRFVMFALAKQVQDKLPQQESRGSGEETIGESAVVSGTQFRSANDKTLFEQTLMLHSEARNTLLQIWKEISQPEISAELLSQLLESLFASHQKINDAYTLLLKDHPNHIQLLRSMALLQLEIFHDEEAAETILLRAEAVEEEIGETTAGEAKDGASYGGVSRSEMSSQMPRGADQQSRASGMSGASGLSKFGRQKKKKNRKKKAIQLLADANNDSSSTRISSVGRMPALARYLILIELLLVLIMSASVWAGFIVARLNFLQFIDGVSHIVQLSKAAGKLGLASIYAKIALINVLPNYSLLTLPDWLPSEEDAIGNMSVLGQSLMTMLTEQYFDDDFGVWIVRDMALMDVQMVGGQVVSAWMDTQSLYDGFRLLAQILIPLVNEETTKETIFETSTRIFLNYPVSVMEGVKRAFNSIAEDEQLNADQAMTWMILCWLVFLIPLFILFMVFSFVASIQVNHSRRKSYLSLMAIPSSTVYHEMLSVSSNDLDGKKQNQNGKQDNGFEEMDENMDMYSMNMSVRGKTNWADVDDYEEEEELENESSQSPSDEDTELLFDSPNHNSDEQNELTPPDQGDQDSMRKYEVMSSNNIGPITSVTSFGSIGPMGNNFPSMFTQWMDMIRPTQVNNSPFLLAAPSVMQSQGQKRTSLDLGYKPLFTPTSQYQTLQSHWDDPNDHSNSLHVPLNPHMDLGIRKQGNETQDNEINKDIHQASKKRRKREYGLQGLNPLEEERVRAGQAVTDDAEGYDEIQKGYVSNWIHDEEFEESLEASAERFSTTMQKFKKAIGTGWLVFLIVCSIVFVLVSAACVVVCIIKINKLDGELPTVRLQAFSALQGFQIALFALNLGAHGNEFKIDPLPDLPQTYSSPYLKHWEHTQDSTSELFKLLKSAYDTGCDVQDGVKHGHSTDSWTDDVRLQGASKEMAFDVLSALAADEEEEYEPVWEEDDEEYEDERIAHYQYVLSLDLLNARWQRKLREFLEEEESSYDLDNDVIAFATTSRLYDMRVVENTLTHAIQDKMHRDATDVIQAVLIASILLTVAIVLLIAVYLIPVMFSLRRASKHTYNISRFIPNYHEDVFEWSTTMQTGLQHLDEMRERAWDASGLIGEEVMKFGPRNEIVSLFAELMSLLRHSFISEENMMAECKTMKEEDVFQHKREHLIIQQQLTILQEQLSSLNDIRRMSSFSHFVPILRKHFSSTDQRLAAIYSSEMEVDRDWNDEGSLDEPL